MASLYKRNGSPYWWIKYQVNAVVRRESTGLRFDDHAQTRSAHELKAEKTLAELRTNPKVGDEHWECWVLPFLEGHCKSPLTLVAYKKAWSTLRPFLAARKIVCPRQLTHAHCRDYHSSRTHPPPRPRS